MIKRYDLNLFREISIIPFWIGNNELTMLNLRFTVGFIISMVLIFLDVFNLQWIIEDYIMLRIYNIFEFDEIYYQKWYGEEKNSLNYGLNNGLILVIIIVINVLLNEFFSINEFSFSIYLNLFLFLSIFRFSSSNILLGGGKEKVLSIIYSGVIVSKKSNGFHKKDFLKKKKALCSDNYNLSYSKFLNKVHISAKGHPIYSDVVVNNNAEFFIVSGNLTTSEKNSFSFVDAGVFHKKSVSIYNQLVINKITNNDDLDTMQKIIDDKDLVYSEKIRSNQNSTKLNTFIEGKSTELTGHKQEIYMPGATFEQKTNKLVNLFEDLKQMNSRED